MAPFYPHGKEHLVTTRKKGDRAQSLEEISFAFARNKPTISEVKPIQSVIWIKQKHVFTGKLTWSQECMLEII
jgi:hypothetical protein